MGSNLDFNRHIMKSEVCNKRINIATKSVPILRGFTSSGVHTINRFEMSNLTPAEGYRKAKRRVARGYGGKGGGTGGRGTRGQKSRSGGGVRTGFEGGQTPLYRRLPKLKGIAGGMSRGSTDFTIVNLAECDRAFSQNETVSLEELKRMRIINCSGRDRLLPLKVLGNGSLSSPLLVKAASFSSSAKSAIEMAGGKAELIK